VSARLTQLIFGGMKHTDNALSHTANDTCNLSVSDARMREDMILDLPPDTSTYFILARYVCAPYGGLPCCQQGERKGSQLVCEAVNFLLKKRVAGHARAKVVLARDEFCRARWPTSSSHW